MWLRELLTPLRSMGHVLSWGEDLGVRVLDYLLVIHGFREAPNFLFIKSVIDQNTVGIWWVGIERLTLDIIELPLLIIIFLWQDASGADYMLFMRFEWLESLKVISLVKGNVVRVSQVAWVLFETLMPPVENVSNILV